MKIKKLVASTGLAVAVVPMGATTMQAVHTQEVNAATIKSGDSWNNVVSGSSFLGINSGTAKFFVMYASNGGWQYCLDNDLNPQAASGRAYKNGAPAGYTKEQWKAIQNIIMHGSTGQGNIGDVAKGRVKNSTDAAAATQMAIWYYNRTHHIGSNQADQTTHQGMTPIMNLIQMAPKANQQLVKDLAASANKDADTAPTGATIAEAKKAAQAKADKNVSDSLNKQKPIAQNSLADAVNKTMQSTVAQSDKALSSIAMKALDKAIEIKPVQSTQSDASKKALKNWNDSDEKNGHVDNVQNGTHDFNIQITKKNLQDYKGPEGSIKYNLPKQVAVQLDKALPEGSVVKTKDGKIIKPVADGKTYMLDYGNYIVQVPFSDQPDKGVNTASAVAKRMMSNATFPAGKISDAFTTKASWQKSYAKTKFASDAKISAADEQKYHLSGGISGVGYSLDPNMKSEQKYALVVQTSVADVSGSVKASSQMPLHVEKAVPVQTMDKAVIKISDALQWNKKLGSLVVEKTDESGKPLKGVTFELVQDSVKNSQVAEYKGSNPLASGDGQNITLPKVTGKDGKATFANLPYGNYELLELQTNKGYELAPDPVKVVIDAKHVDNQNIKFVNSKGKAPQIHVSSEAEKPELHTTAKSKDKDQMIGAGQQPLTDTVEYSGLKPGKTYEISGKLMNKETGKTTGIDKTVKFTPKEANGTVDVDFGKIDASKYAGDKLVAFENLKDSDKHEVANHQDINDKGQTVDVTKPKIHTTATADGKKTVHPDGTVTVNDKVDYEGLIPGETYKLDGVAMDKVTAKPVKDTKEGEVTFKASDSGKGSVDVPVKVDMKNVGKNGLTMFEKAREADDNQVVATHEDINDQGQSIGVDTPQTGTVSANNTPTSPVEQTLAQTGKAVAENPAAVIISVISAVSGAVIISKLRK